MLDRPAVVFHVDFGVVGRTALALSEAGAFEASGPVGDLVSETAVRVRFVVGVDLVQTGLAVGPVFHAERLEAAAVGDDEEGIDQHSED